MQNMHAALCPFFSIFTKLGRSSAVIMGVKTNVSPRVSHHAENIVNNPLLLRRKNRHLRAEKKKRKSKRREGGGGR